MSTPAPTSSKRSPLRLIVGLRGLMLVVLIAGLWMGSVIRQAESQRRSVVALRHKGAIVAYDHEVLGAVKGARPQPWARLELRRFLGDDLFREVTFASLTPPFARPNALSDRDLALLEAFDQLEDLGITDVPISDAGLAHLRNLTSMKRLSLGNSSSGGPRMRVTDAGLAHLRGMTGLRSLDLTGTDVSDAGLRHLRRMTDLEDLGLHGCKVTGSGLAQLGALTKLSELRLSATPLTDAGLVHLRGMTGLRTLWLFRTRTTGAGLVHVSGLTGLRKLILGPENSSDEGLSYIAGLTALEELRLDGTKFTDAGLVHLAGLKTLRSLDISNSSVTDAGLVHLEGLTGLTNLSLSDSAGVTYTGVARLRARLPTAQVALLGVRAR